MNFRIFLLAATLIQVGVAHAAGPSSEPCNQPAALAKVEKAIITDIRKTIATYEAGAGAFSFHFNPVWRNKDAGDVSVYFEKLSADGKTRRAYSAQYSVDAKTCAPKPTKMQALFTDQDSPAGIESASPVPEACNAAAEIPVLHAAIVKDTTYLINQIMPGGKTVNYMYSGVWRVAGAGDMIALFEVDQPGLITMPMMAQYSVDPKTCKPSIKVITAFTWLLTTY